MKPQMYHAEERRERALIVWTLILTLLIDGIWTFGSEKGALEKTKTRLKRLFQAGFLGEPGGIRTHDLLIRSSYFEENYICRWHVISAPERCFFKSALRLSTLKLLRL